MKNPYEGQVEEEAVTFGARSAWFFVALFLVLIALPPIWRNAAEFAKGAEGWAPVREFFRFPSPEAEALLVTKKERDPSVVRERPNLRDQIQAFEEKLDEDTPFSEALRRWTQTALVKWRREGNRKTVIGRGGWLFYRPALDSLTGYGPMTREPRSVADDPTLPPWEGPRDVILEFGAQLREFGVELVLVPVPVKPMIYSEWLGAGSSGHGVIRHPDAERFYTALREDGIEVLDLADAFYGMREAGKGVTPLFLKQDTHWTPRGAQVAAELVADFLRSRPWFEGLASDPGRFEVREETVVHSGDLVGNLDLGEGQEFFQGEEARVEKVIDRSTGKAVHLEDKDSPIVLLGDSFTNIYRQEDMEWGTGAGFAEHLARQLGMTLDVIAFNGQASTGVRKELATRRGSARLMREKKKAVVWTIAARDLMLGETVARETGVEWKPVVFNALEPVEEAVTGDKLVLEGELTMKSRIPDPRQTTYKDALYAAEYRVTKVIDGSLEDEVVVVYHWAFKDRKMIESSRYGLGVRKRLVLVPFGEKKELQGINRKNDSERFDLKAPEFWAEEVGPADGD